MAGCNNGSDFLRIVMDEVARKQGVDRWIDSTPTNIPHMLALAAIFLRRNLLTSFAMPVISLSL